MPIYEYLCAACGRRFDHWFPSIAQVTAAVTCDVCGSAEVRRLISAPAARRSGEGGGGEAEESAPARPEVFGRKELDALTKNR